VNRSTPFRKVDNGQVFGFVIHRCAQGDRQAMTVESIKV
jgi:hypothetical protein